MKVYFKSNQVGNVCSNKRIQKVQTRIIQVFYDDINFYFDNPKFFVIYSTCVIKDNKTDT